MSYNTTRAQKQLYDFIVSRAAAGVAPSFEEMKDAIGLKSKSGVHRLIVALEERGKIARLRNRARSIVPVEDNIFLRLPPDLLSLLKERATARGISTTDIIMSAIVREFAAGEVA